MTATHGLPLSQWLDVQRDDQTLVAWDGSARLTLGQMRYDVHALIQQLLQTKNQKNIRRWALCFDDSYLFTVALLAVLSSGGIPVIPGSVHERLLHKKQGFFDAVVTDLDLSLSCPVVQIERNSAFEPHRDSTRLTLPVISPDALVVLYTSGSTGEAKEVVKSVHCLDAEADCLASFWGAHLQGCKVIATVSHQHQYGLTFRIMLPMALALPFDCRMSQYQEQVQARMSQLHDHAPAFLVTSPAFLKRLDLQLPAIACRFILSAGGVLPWDAAVNTHAWLNVYPHEIYGSTEAGVMAWRVLEQHDAPWERFDEVSLTWREDQHRWWVQSALIPDPYGIMLDDQLQFLPEDDRHFRLTGRYDRIVKLEENRISLTKIENVLQQNCPEIEEAVAMPVWQGKRQVIGVVVVLSSDGRQYLETRPGGISELMQAWQQQARQWLEPIAMPRQWRVVEVIPVNSQSKRDYHQMQEYFSHVSH